MVSDLVAPLAFACRLLMVMWGCGIARWNRVPSIQNLLACKATGSLSPHRKLAKLTNYSPGNTCAASIICDLQGLEELQQRSPPHICRMEEKKICGMQQLQCSAQNVICTIRYYMYSSCQSISATSWKMWSPALWLLKKCIIKHLQTFDYVRNFQQQTVCSFFFKVWGSHFLNSTHQLRYPVQRWWRKMKISIWKKCSF